MMTFDNICKVACMFAKVDYIRSISKLEEGFGFSFCDEKGDAIEKDNLLITEDGMHIGWYDSFQKLSIPQYYIVVPDKYRPPKRK